MVLLDGTKKSGNSILRIVLVGISLLCQIVWLLVLGFELNHYSTLISFLTNLVTLVVVLKLYSMETTSAMKMPWVIVILSFPVLGLCLYFLIELFGDLGLKKRMIAAQQRVIEKLHADETALRNLEQEDPYAANISRYLTRYGNGLVFQNTDVIFYSEAEHALEAMKESLEKAEAFIFMEYFAVSDESAFRELEEILVRKVKQGVEVRLMYDDIGSVGYVNMKFAARLKAEGINCRVFNPALPILNLFMNHRDHRKITVIDGKVGFTGGYNLTDEYFNREHPYGQWKDTGIRLEGEAVQSLTATFLELWNGSSKNPENDEKYFCVKYRVSGAKGYVHPFADTPLDGEPLAENVYINLASCARESLYLITPYLIITDELQRALGLAAKRGVDVRIITPGIPDKKTVFAVTRSYYGGLIAQGVRIFEYSPGFCHAKQCICDGKIVSIGTSNLDFRSLYHHFENNVLLYGCDAVQAIAEDFEKLFPVCEEVTDRFRPRKKSFLYVWQCVLRLFAPLM
ncbi:MAG: cardiolipin synthase [Faecousia sp.]